MLARPDVLVLCRSACCMATFEQAVSNSAEPVKPMYQLVNPAPLRRLQGPQRIWRLSAAVPPPNATGII